MTTGTLCSLQKVVTALYSLLFVTCLSAPDWAHTAPRIRAFIDNGHMKVSGYMSSYDLDSSDILGVSNDWTVVDYTYGTGAVADKYKAQVIVHYRGNVLGDATKTEWDIIIQTKDNMDRINNVLKGHNRFKKDNEATDISGVAGIGGSVLHCYITSTNDGATTTAHIESVGKRANIAITHKTGGRNYVQYGANSKTGSIAMDAIMRLLVNEFQITGPIDLGDFSSRECAYQGVDGSLMYAPYNGLLGRDAFYSQWNFVSNDNEIQRGIDAGITYFTTTGINGVWTHCPSGDAARDPMKAALFPTTDFAAYLVTLGLDNTATFSQFFAAIPRERCDIFKKWHDFFKQNGATKCAHVATQTHMSAFVGGTKIFDPHAGIPPFRVAAKRDPLNRLIAVGEQDLNVLKQKRDSLDGEIATLRRQRRRKRNS